MPSVSFRAIGVAVFGLALAGWMVQNFARDHARNAAESADLSAVVAGLPADASVDVAALQSRALVRLDAEPLREPSLEILSRLRPAPADAAQPDPLQAVLLSRGRRDVATLAAAANDAFKAGRAADAVSYLDALLRGRLDPATVESARAALMQASADPRGFAALVQALDGAPSWRPGFLQELAASGPEDLYPKLTTALAPSPEGGVEPSWRSFLARLVTEGQIGRGYSLWVGLQPPERLGLLKNVFDGSFESDPDGTAFDWGLAQGRGMTVKLAPPDIPHDGRALSLEFSGARVGARLASQALVLPPGSFHLAGDMMLQNLDTQRGISWQIRCIDGKVSTPAGETARFSGSRSWSSFEMDFDIPANGCASQVLQLVLPARIPAEQLIRGAAWFDDIAITRSDITGSVPASGSAAVQ